VSATIRVAGAGDFAGVVRLLEAAGLPTAGLEPTLPHFLVAEEGGRIVGGIGLEVYGECALLRSAVVAEGRRDAGLGTHLVESLLRRAESKGAREIYLLTTTAERFFPRFGFAEIPRAEVAAQVQASEEFRGACPDSAVVMRRVARAG
jgi:amino-acid N-acetyltransferase